MPSHSKDILSRWTFPLVPDDNYPGGERYLYTTGAQYLPKSPSSSGTISRSAQISRHTLIGASTSIGDNSRIVASVIGANCVIGSGVVIEDSYVFEGTTVESGCTVRRSIVGSGVVVREGSEVRRGCLVGDGVVVGPGARLREFERLSVPWKRGEGEGSDEDEDSDVEDMETSELSRDFLKNASSWMDAHLQAKAKLISQPLGQTRTLLCGSTSHLRTTTSRVPRTSSTDGICVSVRPSISNSPFSRISTTTPSCRRRRR